jgi:3-(3-hydroxy-phenyl)propionate hydroxylase
MAANTTQVAVVGAGPTGVTVATLLAQAGIDVVVLERWKDVYPRPRAVHLDDEVFRILARLGVEEELRASTRPARGLQLVDGRHRPLARFSRDVGPQRHGFPQANMFEQPELEAILRRNLRRFPAAELRAGVEVTAVHQHDTGVLLHLVYSATGDGSTLTADYVLGCDGAGSLVREAIGATMTGPRFEQRWLVVDADIRTDLGAWDGVHQVCDSRRAATFMRIGEHRHRWEFALLDDEHSTGLQDKDALKQLLAPWLADIDDQQWDLRRVAEYTFRAQVADRWRLRRLFILGDAAHLTPPFVGQGMGAGIRDAANLGWKLSRVLQGTMTEAALDSYEENANPTPGS